MLAAAHTLLQTNDKTGYEIYEAILAGEKHSKKGLLAGQMDTLKHPQNMALLGFQKGTGRFAGSRQERRVVLGEPHCRRNGRWQGRGEIYRRCR